MKGLPLSMKSLAEHFSRLPGIGSKSAQRLAFYMLRSSQGFADDFAGAILKVKSTVKFCKTCNNLSDDDVCDICKSPSRDRSLLCIVEEPDDIITIERAGSFDGIYHVLLGALSPLYGVGPADLKIRELLDRITREQFTEIVLATDFNTEGEATALYLVQALRASGARISRVAYGIPVGGDLEHADQATIAKAFEGRRLVGSK